MFASIIVREDDSKEADLIAYGLVNRQAVIRLEAYTWATFSECVAYPADTAPAMGLENNVAYEGAYLVGAQIPAGRYIASIVEKAPLSSYSIYDGILGTDANLVKFEVLHDDVMIELIEGEYIELSGCLITKAQ